MPNPALLTPRDSRNSTGRLVFSSRMGLLPTTPLEKRTGLLNYFDFAIGFGVAHRCLALLRRAPRLQA
jgi:hypothetical protein